MTRSTRKGVDAAIDPVRQRNASQADAGQLSLRSTVRVDRAGDFEVRTDESLMRLPDGRLSVAPRGKAVKRLRDLTANLSILSDTLVEMPSTLTASTTVLLLRADLDNNILPTIRAQISTIAAKVNQILEDLN